LKDETTYLLLDFHSVLLNFFSVCAMTDENKTLQSTSEIIL